MKKILKLAVLLGFIIVTSCTTSPGVKTTVVNQQPLNSKMLEHEKLGRGVIAIPLEVGKRVFSGEGTVPAGMRRIYIGWRLLASDPDQIAFNVYRSVGNGAATKINGSPVKSSTNFFDTNIPEGEENFTYTVVPVVDGQEGKSSLPYSVVYNANSKPYKSIKLTGNYSVEKIAFADLDGDGEIDFVVKYPGGNVDPNWGLWFPSQDTYKLQAYRSTGESLWTYDLGWSIEQGTWYSPYLVYDFNDDGKAEVVVKSGEGDPRDYSGIYKNYVNESKGIVQSGPEYLSVLDGMTGELIARVDWPSREPFLELKGGESNGGNYNLSSRNQLGVAYLDGIHPHIIVMRGAKVLMMVQAYRLIGKELKLIWEWNNDNLRNDETHLWRGAAHNFVAADVDGDGCDELLLGSLALDHDGTPLWTTDFGHPDGMHVGDIIPERPGLEIFLCIEEPIMLNGNGMCMVDARTGEIIWGSNFPTIHVHGTGFCSDIDRTRPGRECYGIETGSGKGNDFAVMYTNKGEIIDRDFITTWSAYWDTDNQRELINRDGKISKYKSPVVFYTEIQGRIMSVADILGDWREEIISCVPGEIRIYSTTILTSVRHICLLQDPIYRNYVAEASNGYYHVPMTTYDIPFKAPW